MVFCIYFLELFHVETNCVRPVGDAEVRFVLSSEEECETCEYGALKEELLRDRIVMGIRDKTLSDKLQMDANLTLESAKKQARQKEAVKKHSQLTVFTRQFKKKLSSKVSNQGGAGGSYKPNQQKYPLWQAQAFSSRQMSSYWCNLLQVPKIGHFSGQCLSKVVEAVEAETDSESEGDAFLGALGSEGDTAWTSQIQLQGKEITLKMDTGAEVTVISEAIFHTLNRITMEKPTRCLYGPARQPLETTGKFTSTFKHNDMTYTGRVYVIGSNFSKIAAGTNHTL